MTFVHRVCATLILVSALTTAAFAQKDEEILTFIAESETVLDKLDVATMLAAREDDINTLRKNA